MFNELVGSIVKNIRINSRYLVFEVEDRDPIVFEAYGDCCSTSEFYDFIGVENLIGNKILKVEDLDLSILDTNIQPDWDEGSIEHYGYRFTAFSEEYDEVSAVVSFRNISNGYYGGELQPASLTPEEIN